MHAILIFAIAFLPVRHYAKRIGAWSVGVFWLGVISFLAYFQGNLGAAILFGALAFLLADRKMDYNRYGSVD